MDTSEKVPVGYRCFGALVSKDRTRDLVARTKAEIIVQLYGHLLEEPDAFVRPIYSEADYNRDLQAAEAGNKQRDQAYGHGLYRKEASVQSANMLNDMLPRYSTGADVEE